MAMTDGDDDWTMTMTLAITMYDDGVSDEDVEHDDGVDDGDGDEGRLR